MRCVLGRIAGDDDFLARHDQSNTNVIEVAFLMMLVGSLHHDVTRLDLLEESLELVSAFLNCAFESIRELESATGNLNWMFHDSNKLIPLSAARN